MELTDKVKKTLKDINVEFEDINEIDYDTIIEKLNLYDFDKERLGEYYSLINKLRESINRKYVYLLIEKVKQNLEEFKELGEFIKDKDSDYLIDNIDKILYDNDLVNISDDKIEDEKIRTKYIEDLVDKKYLYLLLEHLESS